MTTIVTRSIQAAAIAALLTGGVQAAEAGRLPKHWEESGQASWYGGQFHGRRTSSGAIFDKHALTAAHDTLPLGAKVRVTMQKTGRSVVVTINDRMPPKRVRVIDLSRGAAEQLGIIEQGVGMVTLTEAPDAEPVEVAEAPDEGTGAVSPRQRGRQHTRRDGRTASAPR